jgi:hypothetical protein
MGNKTALEDIVRNPKAEIVLEKGKAALYIGSGPRVENVSHISGLVDASTYILSDLEFKSNEQVDVAGKTVLTTSKDGFEVLKADPTINFIIIDQAVSYKEKYNAIPNGTYVMLNYLFPVSHISAKYIGLEPSRAEGIFVKQRDASPSDFEIFYKIRAAETLRTSIKAIKNFQGMEKATANLKVELKESVDAITELSAEEKAYLLRAV